MRWWRRRARVEADPVPDELDVEERDPTRLGYDPRITGKSILMSGAPMPRKEREKRFKELGYK